METKSNIEKVSKILHKFGYGFGRGMDAIKASGGLWLGWDESIKGTILEESPNILWSANLQSLGVRIGWGFWSMGILCYSIKGMFGRTLKEFCTILNTLVSV